MYKYKGNSESKDLSCCPMGSLRDSNVVDCYYYGLVKLDDCSKCTVRKDKNIIVKRSV